jgi:hypothetical protein
MGTDAPKVKEAKGAQISGGKDMDVQPHTVKLLNRTIV